MNLKTIILFISLLTSTFANSQIRIGSFSVEQDKAIHYLSGAVITSTVHDLVFEKTKSKHKAVLYSLTTGIVAGALKEIIDSRQKDNRFDHRDLLATTYGSMSIAAVISLDNIFKKKKRKKIKF